MVNASDCDSDIMGSIPISHPIGDSPSGKALDFDSRILGSNPRSPLCECSLMIEPQPSKLMVWV